jgi:glycosyltransferase involved in cell wall biosynthesis
MKDESVSVCLTIHNQENVIGFVASSVIACVSENVKEIICLFDGCTDKSEQIVRETFELGDIPVKYLTAPNVWEVRANNQVFKESSYPYILTLQDDMVLQEINFDQKMLKPFRQVDNLLGITNRNAQDEYIQNGKLLYRNVAGSDVNSPKDYLFIRDIIVRGPIMFDHVKLAEMNYLNDEFAPIYADDYDLCFRAWKEKNYVVGSYILDYMSPEAWGVTRKHNSAQHDFWYASAMKNEKMIMERYADIMGGFHSQNIYIEDK